METNKIFSKLNIKNYNNILEEILEEKLFSLDVKNLLLSMLYKIGNAYKDYETVKREVLPKKDFISYLIKVIKENCFEIEFIGTEEERKPQVDKKKGKILCHPNEKSLLEAIWYMGEKETSISPTYSYTKEAIEKMIKIGSNISQVEVIRDFNGWSWDIVVKEIENIEYNILYQSLLLIDGKELIYDNIDSEEKNSILTQKKQKEFADFLETLYSVTMKLYSTQNSEIANQIAELKAKKTEELALFQDKKEFVQKITNEKRECNKKIQNIDKTINNTELLKIEYQERNSKLPNKEKIFSISHLVDRLEKERKELLEQMKYCNKMIDPKEFVKAKEKLREEVEFLNGEKSIIDSCRACLQCAKKQIEKIEEKADIIEWIYKIRYYYHIPFDENTSLKDIEGLEKDFKEVIKLLIKKAQTQKIWDHFTENEEIAYIVIKELFRSKMINFENVNIVCKYENGILYLEYYDGSTLETKSELKIENVRIKKKIKLFI